MTQETTELRGTTQGWEPPGISANGKPTPGKLTIDLDGSGETVEVVFYPNHIPLLAGKDGSGFLGLAISVQATYKTVYNNIRQFGPTSQVVVLGGQSAPPVHPVQQAPQAPPPASRGTSRDPQRDSIERQVAAKDATAIVISTGFLRDAPPALTLDLWNYWYRHILNTIQGTPTDFDINPEGKREEYRRAGADPLVYGQEVDVFGDQIQPLATFNDEEEE